MTQRAERLTLHDADGGSAPPDTPRHLLVERVLASARAVRADQPVRATALGLRGHDGAWTAVFVVAPSGISA